MFLNLGPSTGLNDPSPGTFKSYFIMSCYI